MMAPEATKLSVSAQFLPANLRELASEFNRLRAQPSSPHRTQSCDMLVAKALTQCMDLGSHGKLVESVIDECLKGSSGRAPPERRWELVLYLLENSPLFIQNIARAVVQEVAVAKLVPINLLRETIELVQRQGSVKDFDAPIRKAWMDTVLPLLQRLQLNAVTSVPPPIAERIDRVESPAQRNISGRSRPGSHRGVPLPSHSTTTPPVSSTASLPRSTSPPSSRALLLSLPEPVNSVGNSTQDASPSQAVSPSRSPPRDSVIPEARTVAAETIYLFGKQIGKGSFATVYEGMHRQSRTPVALKMIPKLKVGSPASQQMLRNEVTSLLKLNHPHIVRLFDVFEDAAKFTLVLELLRGRELFDKLVERGRYSEQDASAAMRQVFDAVAYLHSHMIAHRDLKPENILSVERNGREVIKLADFGLARTFGDGSAMSTACGSPLYVAPEIIRGEHYGPEVDMWACGVILYVLLAGYALSAHEFAIPFLAVLMGSHAFWIESPFPNGPDNDLLFDAVLRNDWVFGPPWLSLSDDAKDLVKRLMTPDPRRRINAAQTLQHAWILRSAALPSVPLSSAYAALSRNRLNIHANSAPP